MGDIKIYDISEIIDKCKSKFFVETGTLLGDAVEHVRQYKFDKIISFEIIEELADKAKERFKDDSRVDIVLGDSSKVLPKALDGLNGNAIFWLDAHFPGADIGINSYTDDIETNTNLPLEREIRAIAARVGKYNDVIIIDDLWIYEDGEWEWGTFDNHMIKHGNSVRRSDLCAGDASFIRELFNETHNIKVINRYQGSLVLIPKST
jgi:hypothetical protein